MAQKPTYSNASGGKSPNYAVRSGVPVPPKIYTRKSKYPFGTMKLNEMTTIPDKSYRAVMGLLRRHKAHGKGFTVRTTPKGIQVWRTK